MKLFSIARHWFWVAPLVLGVMFIAGGLYMVREGRDAKDEVRDAIVRENITTSQDASLPNVQVTNAATATALILSTRSRTNASDSSLCFRSSTSIQKPYQPTTLPSLSRRAIARRRNHL